MNLTTTHTHTHNHRQPDRQQFPVNGAVIKCRLMDSMVREDGQEKEEAETELSERMSRLRRLAAVRLSGSGDDSLAWA